jgi:L-lactate dehydrogenase complex protein LldG
MSEARENIIARLRAAQSTQAPDVPSYAPMFDKSGEDRIAHFIAKLEAVHGRVERVTRANWRARLDAVLVEYQVQRLLIGAAAEPGRALVQNPPSGIALVSYDLPVDDWKHALFNEVDAALTGSAGAIAETGSVILWPSAAEPRLMSLVPPLHIVVVDVDRLYGTFAEAVRTQGWADGMPTNALLISGPSKTADIEMVLAYGVHGPKTLVVLLRE